MGRVPEKKEFVLGDSRLKAPGLQIEWTKENIKEYEKCFTNILYFVKNYIKVVHIDKGLIPFIPYSYQKKIIKLYEENRFVIMKLPRQSGKSITTVAYILHYILFNEDKTVGILANRAKTARGILQKLKAAYRQLPFFLQAGVVEWNKGSITLENGCTVFADATSESAARSESISLLILDEFAFVEQNKAEGFMRSVYPTISSGQSSKIFIFSTPNGMNLFYKLWTDAKEERNEYTYFSINWNDVPGRDRNFKKQTIANIGLEAWNQEFECKFIGSGGTLLSSATLSRLVFQTPLTIIDDDLKLYEEPKKDHIYAINVDPSEGLGLDYSAFVVTDITELPYRQCAVYKSNVIDPYIFPDIIARIGHMYNNALVLVEINGIGNIVVDLLHNNFEYDNIIMTSTLSAERQSISGGFGKSAKFGFKMTKFTKRIGCSMIKTLIETDGYIINDFDTIKEFSSFVRDNKQSYSADEGQNDDIVMCLVGFGWLSNQQYFKDLTDLDIRKRMFDADLRMKAMEEAMLPFGYIQDAAFEMEKPDKVSESDFESFIF